MRMLAKLPLALAAVLLSTTATASAAPELVTDSYLFAGEQNQLALAGSAALVGTQGAAGAEVRSFTPGQAPRVIDSGESGFSSVEFAASSSRIAELKESHISGYKGTPEFFQQQLVSGPFGAAPAALPDECSLAPSIDETIENHRSFESHSAIAIDGEVVAYDSYACLVIHDFASGLQRIIQLAATLDPVANAQLVPLPQGDLLRVAVRLVAYRANPPGGEGPASVTVYDIDTGSALYSAPLRPEGPRSQPPSFALQADGTLLIAYPSRCEATISTPVAPTPRPLGIPACDVHRLLGGRALLVAPGPGEERQLKWSSLEAPMAHPIAALGVHGILEAVPPEMNESTVLYALSGCYPRVYRAPRAEPGAPPPLPASCPLHVSPPARRSTAKSLSVTLRCPIGCRGRFTAWIRTAKQLRAERGGQPIGSEPDIGPPASTEYALPPDRPQTFKLLPTGEDEEHPTARTLARQLRRHHRLWLALFFKTDTPNAERVSDEEASEVGVTTTRSSQVNIPIVAVNATKLRAQRR